jgi:hydrophobic/amphiphilic exporter-1 (mainly G- bacteria), HAE1 family
MNLTEISIRRPSLLIVVFSVLLFMGGASYRSLPIELVPKFSAPVITVMTIYPGASPSEVENAVSKPIEEAISSLEGLDQVQVSSMENASFVAVEFDQKADLDLALANMQRKINAILAQFPKEVRPPVLNKFALDELPVIRMGVSANLSGTAFFDLIKNRVVPELAQVSGVAQVQLLGGQEREIKININSERLESFGLSLLQVSQAVQASNLDFPTGKIKDEEGQALIRLAGKFQSLDEIRNLVVGRSKMGSSIFLKDIAEVADGVKDTEVLCRAETLPAVGISIRKQNDANAVEMSDLLKKKLTFLEKNYAKEQLHFNLIADQSTFTRKAAKAVIDDLFIAVGLVALIMLLFLHSLRNALIVLVSIPTSIISTFVMMKLCGYSLNLMSLLGLSLAVGILVDDAIVVLENIYRHLETGKNRVKASYDGRAEIGYTAVSITLIDVVIFLPIIFTVGLVPNLLRQFCMTVLTSTLMSLLVSFTLVPWLASRFAQVTHFSEKTFKGRFFIAFEKILDWISEGFVTALRWILTNSVRRWAVLMAAFGLFMASFLLVKNGFIGSAFMEQGEKGEFLIQVELPKNATLAQTNDKTREVETAIRAMPEVVGTFTTVGTNNKSFGLNSAFTSEILVKLVPMGAKRTVKTPIFARQTKVALEEKISGARIKSVPIDILGLSFSPIEVMLIGPDLDSLFVFSKKVKSVLETVPGAIEIESTVEAGNPELRVDIDRKRMADFGLTMAQVGLTMQTAFSGNSDARFRDENYEYGIRIQLDAFDRRNANDLRNIAFINPLGQTVYLKQFADIQESTGPTRLERRDRLPSLMLTAQVIGRPIGTVSRELKAKLDQITTPTGAYIKYGGDIKRTGQAVGTLGFALFVSILLVYLVMVALYDSWVYPFVVLFSIPLSLIGALLALALAGQNITVFTALGLLVLVGLVGKNAILVVDFANQLIARGVKMDKALFRATKLRFRPVLMTNVAMVVGLLPIAYAQGTGAEWKNGLAWAIIGGLSSSMFLSLLVVPVVYYMITNFVNRLGFGKKPPILVDTEYLEIVGEE